jgi:hypothetical protein
MKLPSKLRNSLACCLLSLSAGSVGCGGDHVLIVPPGNPVRLAEPARAKVWVPGGAAGTWVRSSSAVEIPAGWVAWPPASQPSR